MKLTYGHKRKGGYDIKLDGNKIGRITHSDEGNVITFTTLEGTKTFRISGTLIHGKNWIQKHIEQFVPVLDLEG